MKLVGVNEQGKRMGEDHGRATLSNHDVELVLELLECREMLIREYTKVGLRRGDIDRALHAAQLSFAGIAEKFECSKSNIRMIAVGTTRGRMPDRWKRVAEPEKKHDRPKETDAA